MQNNPTDAVPECRIFYSWQSDTDYSTGRTFTIKAFEKAVQCLNERPNKPLQYVADHGCSGDGGSLNIATRMLEKIDNCDLYIADLTIVHSTKTDPLIHGRRAPNPNVMFELGYAVKQLGWEKVIILFNESYGAVELLPFDVQQHRAVIFKREPNRATEAKNHLKKLLKAHKDDIDNELSAVSAAVEALEKIDEKIRQKKQSSTTDALKELVKDLMCSISATETENVGGSSKKTGTSEEALKGQVVLSARLSDVEAVQHDALQKAEKRRIGETLYRTCTSIDDSRFPKPSSFFEGNGEKQVWDSWVTLNREAIIDRWDENAGASASILNRLSRTKTSQAETYEQIIKSVEKCYPKSKFMRHGW